jgi:hypothetical protein
LGSRSRTLLLLPLLALLPAAAAAADPQPAAPAAVRAGTAATDAYVGPESCKACHPAAYDVWRTGPHARAFDALPAASQKDPRCLSCHSPDADQGGGAGVTCEACHGPGRMYSAPYVMRDGELARLLGLVDPSEKACLACHGESAPSLVRFEYTKKLPLIDHWTKERAARAAPAAPEKAPAPAPAAPATKGK